MLQSNRPTRVLGQMNCPPGYAQGPNGQCVVYSPPSAQVMPGAGGASQMVQPGHPTAGYRGYPQQNTGMRVLTPPSGMFGRRRR